jgi:hypothetical protein
MRKKAIIYLALVLAFAVFASAASAADKLGVRKVILDTDMRWGPDDGQAMVLLARFMLDKVISESTSPSVYQIDLLGVTVEPGGNNAANGFATGIRQLEVIEAQSYPHQPDTKLAAGASGVPIYMGTHYGLKAGRATPEVMKAEIAVAGRVSNPGYLAWATNAITSADYRKNNPIMDPDLTWQEYYKYRFTDNASLGIGKPSYPYAYWPLQRDGTSKADPDGIDNAIDFLVKAINDNPGEITLCAIGPCTNIALALRKDPSIAAKVKEVVYMGGSFYIKGDSLSAAEFNWWADPEAAKMVVRTDWGSPNNEYGDYGNQIVNGLEANVLGSARRLPSVAAGGAPDTAYPTLSAEEAKWYSYSRWFYDGLLNVGGYSRDIQTGAPYGVIAAAWIIDPDLIVSWYGGTTGANPNPTLGPLIPSRAVYIDVDSEYGQNYGRSTAYGDGQSAPLGTKKAAIMGDMDFDKFHIELIAPAQKDYDKTSPTYSNNDPAKP